MGINSLLHSTLLLVGAFTNFGLSTSAVKDIAHAYGAKNDTKVAVTIVVLRRLIWITGVFGFVMIILLAPILSSIAFNSQKYSTAFVFISISILLSQITSGQNVILQGFRKLKQMASSSILGAIFGLLISLPLYFYFNEQGIVPAIVLSSLTGLFISWYYASKISISKVSVGWAETWVHGKGMLRLGFMLSLSGLISVSAAYFLKIFMSSHGGYEQVGLYDAGLTIINSYVGMVFTAMSTDYYPRLTAEVDNIERVNENVSHQSEISALILAPIISVFIILMPFVVTAIYSSKFSPIIPLLYWSSLGIMFKSYSWTVAFIFLAKGSSKAYFFNELIANIYIFILNILGYYLYGLAGLGFSFLIGYLLYLLQVVIVARRLYCFTFHVKSIRLLYIQLIFIAGILAIIFTLSGGLQYVFGSVIALACIIYSLYEIHARVDLLKFLKEKYIKQKNKRIISYPFKSNNLI